MQYDLKLTRIEQDGSAVEKVLNMPSREDAAVLATAVLMDLLQSPGLIINEEESTYKDASSPTLTVVLKDVDSNVNMHKIEAYPTPETHH